MMTVDYGSANPGQSFNVSVRLRQSRMSMEAGGTSRIERNLGSTDCTCAMWGLCDDPFTDGSMSQERKSTHYGHSFFLSMLDYVQPYFPRVLLRNGDGEEISCLPGMTPTLHVTLNRAVRPYCLNLRIHIGMLEVPLRTGQEMPCISLWACCGPSSRNTQLCFRTLYDFPHPRPSPTSSLLGSHAPYNSKTMCETWNLAIYPALYRRTQTMGTLPRHDV